MTRPYGFGSVRVLRLMLAVHCPVLVRFSSTQNVGSISFVRFEFGSIPISRSDRVVCLQVIGKLAFEDANHKRLLQLVLAGPVFPPNRESSPEFQELIVSILKRENERVGIPEIRKTTWFSANTLTENAPRGSIRPSLTS